MKPRRDGSTPIADDGANKNVAREPSRQVGV